MKVAGECWREGKAATIAPTSPEKVAHADLAAQDPRALSIVPRQDKGPGAGRSGGHWPRGASPTLRAGAEES
eukprot:3374254-Pyramimonas_sp.AAC.1